jgi:hypothetical protein
MTTLFVVRSHERLDRTVGGNPLDDGIDDDLGVVRRHRHQRLMDSDAVLRED